MGMLASHGNTQKCPNRVLMFCRDAAVDGREKQGCETFCTPSDTCVNVPDNWNDQASTAITDTGYACLAYECVLFLYFQIIGQAFEDTVSPDSSSDTDYDKGYQL